MLHLIKTIIGKCIRILYRLMHRFVPVHSKTILFISFHGKGYSDNPKALYEYMRQQKEYEDYTFVWAIKHKKQKAITIEGAKVIEYFSIPYFYYLSKAKYWFVNCKLPMYIIKKDSQVYLQTWHGTPLKRLAHDIEVPESTTFYRSKMNVAQMYQTYDEDVKKYNYMISPNTFSTNVFQSAFQINKERLIETGYPRNDVLVNTQAEEIKTLKEKLGLPMDKKVILYAPTWRDNSYVSKGYTFHLEVNFALWQQRLKDEYVVLFKPHYLIINDFDIAQYKGFVYEMAASCDISTLYLVSDLLITDYSSVFFDYAILQRPIYFYMFDRESYAQELRGFYFDIHETLPGDIVEKEQDLLDKIVEKRYDYKKLERFNKTFNAWHDGTCSKKVLDIVFHK